MNNKIKRYDPFQDDKGFGMKEAPCGDYVTAKDYFELEQRLKEREKFCDMLVNKTFYERMDKDIKKLQTALRECLEGLEEISQCQDTLDLEGTKTTVFELLTKYKEYLT